MATYLFTWNPRKWDWKNLDQQVKICNRAGHVLEGWSCGLRKNIQPGDRAFMLCQGKGPRGIMASGRVVTDREEHRHWDKSKAKLGRKATVVDIDWDVLINPMKGPIFVRARLNEAAFAGMFWDPQSSGTRIPDAVAKRLEVAWAKFRGVPTVQQFKRAILLNREVGSRRSGGAGFGNAENNRAVEKAAIRKVTSDYKAKGWLVVSVESSKCGYDLRCTLAGKKRHVEVKGIKGEGEKFFITANEFGIARRDSVYELCLVLKARSQRAKIVRYTTKELLRDFELEPLTYSAKKRTI